MVKVPMIFHDLTVLPRRRIRGRRDRPLGMKQQPWLVDMEEQSGLGSRRAVCLSVRTQTLMRHVRSDYNAPSTVTMSPTVFFLISLLEDHPIGPF